MKRLHILVLILAALAPYAPAGLNSHFYRPNHQIYTTPTEYGSPYETVSFQSADGTVLNGWFVPAHGQAFGTVIHFHGNARNMSSHYPQVSWLPAKGFNLFVFDYRGYGKSQGTPSRKGVYEDSVAAVEYIQARSDTHKLILFGQSLGCAQALAVLGKNHFKDVVGIAIDSPFSSYKSIAVEHVTWLKPVAYLLIGNSLSPKKYVGNISPTPLLIIHGTADQVIAYKHAHRLFKKANEPKMLWTMEGGRHLDALTTHKKETIPRLHALFAEWLRPVGPLSDD